ncbi:MAG: BACON domain-containing protein [Bacteroidales bacterium]|nr:BACON domain-containing protein [Bacteroidales bacterium]
MRKSLVGVPVLAALLLSCESKFSFDAPLSLASYRVELEAAEGETPVIVYANGAWTASLSEGADWARIEGSSGNGLGQVRFIYDANEGLARRAVIDFQSAGETRSVALVQKAGFGDVQFAFAAQSIEIPRNGASGALSFVTNLPASEEGNIVATVLSEEGGELSWIGGLRLSGSSVAFSVEANATGADRAAVITLSYTDVMETEYRSSLKLTQKDEAPYLSFPADVTGLRYSSLSATVTLPFTTNLLPYLGNMLQAADASAAWAKLSLAEDGIPAFLVQLEENPDAASRQATLTFPFTDASGVTAPFSYILVQKGKTPRFTFAEVKALVTDAAYPFVQDGALEGVVISDMDSPNLETAPNLTPSTLDTSLNGVTGYLQSPDGTQGFRLVFASRSDNILHRGDRVVLDLNGTTVTKEEEPLRYTIEGVKASALAVGDRETPVAREKTLAELTDTDLYTLVKVKGLEMSFKHGAYTNCHDGYALSVAALNPAGQKTNASGASSSPQKFDTTPCSMTDAAGNEVNLLINNNVTWRRYGNGVPQGTCDVTGIVVHTALARWARNGDLGRYQVRPLEEADIAPAGDAFSRVIVSWYKGWDDSRLTGADAIAVGLHGNGTITSNVGTAQTVVNFNDLTNYNASPAVAGSYKGQVNNGALGFAKTGGYFWASNDIDDMDAAPWFCITFSTEGLSGSNLVLVWSAAQGSTRSATDDIQGPTQYRVEYSTDGTRFTALDRIYAMHPIVSWSDSLAGGFSVPGLHQYVTKLPASLLGQPQVQVRIRAASNKSLDNAYLTPEGGTIKNYPASNYTMVRFGELTVQYNP